jgi:hypothetical protein
MHQAAPQLHEVHLRDLFRVVRSAEGLLGWTEFKRAMYLLGKVSSRVRVGVSSTRRPVQCCHPAKPHLETPIIVLGYVSGYLMIPCSPCSQGHLSDNQRSHVLRGMQVDSQTAVRPRTCILNLGPLEGEHTPGPKPLGFPLLCRRSALRTRTSASACSGC